MAATADTKFGHTILRLAIGALLMAGVGILVAMPLEFEHRTLGKHFADGLHVPMMVAVTWIVAFALRPSRLHWILEYTRTVVLAGGVMIGVEILQPLVGRSRSMVDVLNGTVGLFIGMLLLLIWDKLRNVPSIGAGLIIAGVLTFWRFQPAYTEWSSLRWQREAFPSLGGFESAAEMPRWRSHGDAAIARVSTPVKEGGYALSISTPGNEWAGVSQSVGVRDWKGYDAVELHVHTSVPFPLELSVQDKSEQAVDKRFDLKPGWNHLIVELADLDVSRMDAISLIATEEVPAVKFVVDDIKATKSK